MTTANTQPQWAAKANVVSAIITTGNNSSEGGGTIGTDTFLLTSAGANDSELDGVILMPTSTAAATSTQACVARFYLSTVSSGSTTSSNTKLIGEQSCASQAADHATNQTTPVVWIPPFSRLPTGTFLLVQQSASPAASTQWDATAFARDY
jgi:hypothetical protein